MSAAEVLSVPSNSASSQSPELSPINTKQVVRNISGKRVDVISYSFADKIMILISQNGNLGKMYCVPLTASAAVQPYSFDMIQTVTGEDYSLLPLNHLTPISVLGASPDDTQGRIYAVQIASLIIRQSPDERRLVVVGMAHGMGGESVTDENREMFLDVLQMVGECRVW
ncbi:hypothetical protein POJ06DRAFT_251001 [Lipomyces tetrasporus]|uniref:Proteasome assembly chaperone 3 n=1 Tax=Lipomyces tetrasporus TaxID=54092 RepID=A0AAD7QTL3_9ASCO|nr:uncharacterized protein POJ06DRAFT_251001 [Lipomyces tetrasporus]KAJ8101262.1 hypothetical protein POJ06DRAFT_251001 [Lipomyces tetrasporus]